MQAAFLQTTCGSYQLLLEKGSSEVLVTHNAACPYEES